MIKKLFSSMVKGSKIFSEKLYHVLYQIFSLIRVRFFHVATPEFPPVLFREEKDKGCGLLKRRIDSGADSTFVIGEDSRETGALKEQTICFPEEESIEIKTTEIPPLLEDQRLSLCETLDRILNTGVVIHGDITISVANIDLIYIGLRSLITSVETARKLQDG